MSAMRNNVQFKASAKAQVKAQVKAQSQSQSKALQKRLFYNTVRLHLQNHLKPGSSYCTCSLTERSTANFPILHTPEHNGRKCIRGCTDSLTNSCKRSLLANKDGLFDECARGVHARSTGLTMVEEQ